MTPRRRFIVWIVNVVAVLVVSSAWFVVVRFSRDTVVLWGGAMLVLALLGGLAWLIVTTPPDAVRLSVLRSALCLALGSAELSAVAALTSSPTRLDAIKLAALPLQAAALAVGFSRVRKTPWSTALLLWNPLVVGPLSASSQIVVSAITLVVGVFAMLTANRRPV